MSSVRGGILATVILVSALTAASCARVIGAADPGIADPPAVCVEQADCSLLYDDGPHACIAGACVPLLDDRPLDGSPGGECRVVLGAENLRSDIPPFFFGALAWVTDRNLLDPTSQDIGLAVEEFSTHGGVKIGGETRLPVGVVCNVADVSPESLDRSLDHLVDDLGIRAVVASIGDSTELARSFERLYRERQRDVFLLSPFQSDELLSALDDDGLVWQMLGSPLSVADAYPPLVRRVERHLDPHDEDGSPRPVRLALVNDDQLPYPDIANRIDATLIFNDKTPRENGADYYRRFRFVGTPDDERVMDELVAFEPDIVVGAMRAGFLRRVPELEARLASSAPELHPFYVLSPSDANVVQTSPPSMLAELRTRIAGVNPAGAEDTRLYDAYIGRFRNRYLDAQWVEGHENFYDAAYFLLYAASAAGDEAAPSGASIARGMTRLLDGTSFDVGAEDIPRAVQHLEGPDGISLQGTLGPPEFDETGARLASGSVWCVADDDGELAAHFDVLRVDGANGELRGDFDCFDF